MFARRRSLPTAVLTRLDVPVGDRVLAAAELRDGRWAAVTRRALYVAGPEGPVDRLPWAAVDRAVLEPTSATLTVMRVTGEKDDLVLADAHRSRAFAQAFRERVQSSVVHSETVTLPGGTQVRVALRRDEDGELLSQVIGDGTVDLTDPTVAALVDAAEERVRAAAGLPS